MAHFPATGHEKRACTFRLCVLMLFLVIPLIVLPWDLLRHREKFEVSKLAPLAVLLYVPNSILVILAACTLKRDDVQRVLLFGSTVMLAQLGLAFPYDQMVYVSVLTHFVLYQWVTFVVVLKLIVYRLAHPIVAPTDPLYDGRGSFSTFQVKGYSDADDRTGSS